MKWRDKFWSAYGVVANTTIDITANALNAVGSLACMAGGAGFAIAYVLDETLTASYFGSAHTTGEVTVDAGIAAFDSHVHEVFPFQQDDKMVGGLTYNLKNYLHPDTVRAASGICLGSGTVLRVMGANLKLWQQSRIEKAYFKSHHGVAIDSPSSEEYLLVNSESVFGSLSYTFVSASAAAIVINGSGLIGSHQSVTYPADGKGLMNSTHYSGPVASYVIPVAYKIGKNISFPFFGKAVEAIITEKVDAVANTTYGGGLFFQSHVTLNPPIVIPGLVGSSAHLASSFFSMKAREKRDERIFTAIGDKAIGELDGSLNI